jgi:hypothetical protein
MVLEASPTRRPSQRCDSAAAPDARATAEWPAVTEREIEMNSRTGGVGIVGVIIIVLVVLWLLKVI